MNTERPSEPSPLEEVVAATDERLTHIEDVCGSNNATSAEVLREVRILRMQVEEALELLRGERQARIDLRNELLPRLQALEALREARVPNGS